MKTQTSDTIDEIVSLIREEGKEFRKEWRHLDSKRKEYQSEGQDRIELYTQMQEMGYIVILKPTLELPDGTVKGNVDAELVLHAMIEYPNYDKAIIVSGDGDFHCLVEHLHLKDKLLKIIVPNKKYSSLLKKFSNLIVNVSLFREKVQKRQN